MPRYDVRCQTCGHQFEVVCRHEELENLRTTSCAECLHPTLVRIYSAPPTPHFKGSGFYATDYKGKK